eukprot:135957_1
MAAEQIIALEFLQNEGVTTTHWNMASKSIIKKAIEIGRVQYAVGLDNKLSKSVRNFFYQLRDNQLNDDSNASKLLPWAICSANEGHMVFLSGFGNFCIEVTKLIFCEICFLVSNNCCIGW